MFAAEFSEFEKLLRQHSWVYGKKLTDEAVQGYWDSLKDLAFPVIKRCADFHLRHAKFFPKPCELRPKDEKPASGVKTDHTFQTAVEQNLRHWDELLRKDPLGTKRMLLGAYVARIGVQEHPGSIAYAEKMVWAKSVGERLDREGA